MQLDEQLNVILKGRKFKKMLDHIFERTRAEYGLRRIELEIMFYLSRRPYDPASEISRSLFLNRGHVSQAMNNLCVRGCLESCIDPDDRRYVAYRITEKGTALMREAARIRHEINEQLLRGITDEELKVMERVSAVISDNIERISVG